MSGRRPGEWEQVGGNPAPGRPGAYFDLARKFRETADDAAEARRRLTALRDASDAQIWRGKAADSFRDGLGPSVEKLRKLYDSYDRAAQALSTYGVALRELQTEAGSLLDEAIAAIEQRNAHDAARGSVPGIDTLAGVTASRDDAIEAEEARLRLARERLERIGDERRAAEAKAVAGLEMAGDLGIQNNRRSLVGSVFHGVTSVADDAWDATGGRVVTGFAESGRDILGGAGAVVDYVGDNWQGLLATGAVVTAGATLIVTGVGVGAGVGILVGAGSSAFSQVLTDGEVDWNEAALAGAFGGAGGYVGGKVSSFVAARLAAGGLSQMISYAAGGAASGMTSTVASQAQTWPRGGEVHLDVLLARGLVGAAVGFVGGAAPTEALRRTVSIGGSVWWSISKARGDAGLPLPRAPWDPRGRIAVP